MYSTIVLLYLSETIVALEQNSLGKMLTSSIKKIDYVFVFYISILIYSVFFTTRFFGTNDDMLMMLLSSGIYTSEPSEYIVFQNILSGLFLKNLYLINNSINWYVLLLSSIQIISFITLYFIFKKYLTKTILLLIFVLPLTYFIIEFNTYLQFTKVGFISCSVGILFFLVYIKEENRKYLIYSFFFILTGYIIREQTLYASGLITFPMLLILIKNRIQIFQKKEFIFYILIVLLSLASTKVFNETYYTKNKEWKYYKELKDIRGWIYYDRSITKECFYKNAQKYNISKNDVISFYKWTNDDKNIYTPELFHYIKNNCSKKATDTYNKLQNINFYQAFINKFFSFNSYYLIFFCLLLILLNKKYSLFLYFIFFIIVLIYLYTMTFENRVVSSLLLEFYLLILIFNSFNNKFNVKEIVIIIGSSIILMYHYYSILPQMIYKKARYNIEKDFSVLENNYIIISKSRNFFNYLPLDTKFNNLFENIKIYYIGWNLSSPDNNKVLNKSSNFYELLLTKTNVILYADGHRIPVIKKFIEEHYNKKIDFKLVDKNYYKLIN